MEKTLIRRLVINQDIYNKAIEMGYTDNQSKILGSKLDNVHDMKLILDSSLNHLPSLNNIGEINEASALLHKHIEAGSHIALVTDSDMDGISSAYILFKGISKILGVDPKKLTVIINKRINGNGITEKLLETIMDEHMKRPIGLVISADHGSANGPTIKKMMDDNIDVLITDHHLVPEKDNAHIANAFVNPQKDESLLYKNISGCAVAFLLVVNTKNKYPDTYLDTEDYSHRLLPVVGASTIGDAMKLNDPINRAFVIAGLKEMNTLRDPIWQAFKYVSDSTGLFTEEFLSFNLISVINSCNRMGEPILAFNFYNSNDYQDAVVNFTKMGEKNDRRKKIQKDLVKDAEFQLFDSDNMKGLTVVLEKGFGINGVISSMVGEKHYKPIMTFVKHDGEFHGSGRAINESFDLHKALHNMKERDVDMFLSLGGHKGACGCRIPLDKVNEFRRMFDEEASHQLDDSIDNKKTYDVLDDLNHEKLNESLIEDIRAIAPFGMGFDKIRYVGTFTIEKVFYIGKANESVSIRFKLDTDEQIDCFIYNSQSMFNHEILKPGKRVKVVYVPKIDEFRGALDFKLAVEYIEEIHGSE